MARFDSRKSGRVAIAVFVTISLVFLSFSRVSQRAGSLSFSAGSCGITPTPTTEQRADKMLMIVPFVVSGSSLLPALAPTQLGEQVLHLSKQLVAQLLHLWPHPGEQVLHFV